MTLAGRLLDGFAAAYGGRPDLVVRAPGRVNLIGEHTDYNDGFALPCAIGVETRVALRRRADGQVHVAALDFAGERDAFAVAADPGHADAGGWRDYVRGVVAILVARGHAINGADLAVAGDIPRGTGLSSSASLQVALAGALLRAAGIDADPVAVALVAQAAENDFVGVRCGNLDQLASAGAQAGAALLIDCRGLDLAAVPVPAGTALVIVQSGVERGLLDGQYNARRAACEAAARTIGVPALRDADMAALEAARGRMDAETFRRARHVVTENARTLAAAAALAAGDLPAMGRLMAESHASMRDDFGITVPATDTLAALLDDAIGGEGGARQTGGGFGGAVVAVMPEHRAAAIARIAVERYRTPAGDRPLVMVERPVAGAGPIPEPFA